MEKKEENLSTNAEFSEIVKRTYDRVMQENEISFDQLIKDLKADLKHLVAHY